ncbi:MAG TPA: glycosyltransferase, partial [Thermoanaerobaculia bacterium]|nr:glycosyltransferase [Thermoanaerobaculia bacterium]
MSRGRGANGALAILVKRFPRLSETFILNEIVELRRQGLPLRLFAIADANEPYVQPEAETLRPELSYLRYGRSVGGRLRLLSDLIWAVLRHTAGFVRAARLAARRGSAATWRHFREACTLARRMDTAGLRHLHAHFASGPSSVAYYVHLMTGDSFSFTGHARDVFTTPPRYIVERSAAARFVATCTDSNRLYLESLGEEVGRKVVVIPHGIDVDLFTAIERRPERGRLLSIGRLVPKKGFDVLLRAVALLAEKGIDVRLHLIGDGPLRGELAALAASMRIGDRVVFGGARPQPELLDELASAEVFVLSPVVMPDGDRDGVP